MNVEQAAAEFRADFDTLRAEIGKVIVGCNDIVDGVLTGLFAGGHCLLEGVPGLGKTQLVKTLSEAVDLPFSRIQFTPDLMPADIIGTSIILEDDSGKREVKFRKGPIFSNILLADEINRATPKTQSALLEAMQEHTVSVARTTHRLDEPFFVLATQNPIEMEGTYPLPEAQVDRFFFKLLVESPNEAQLGEILDRTTKKESVKISHVMDAATVLKWQGFVREVVVAPKVTSYVVRLALATQPKSPLAAEMARNYARFGASPRGAQAMLLAGKVNALRDGRYNVGFLDIQKAALPALRHRLLLNFEAEADGVTADQIIGQILENTAEAAKVA
ncbi:MAG: MoxR family ATPase [Candidatus Hydrogenedentota bacterium]